MPVKDLYLFPLYATREQYEKATGQVCPPWKPYQQPKGWFDPNAAQSPSRVIVYPRAFVLHEVTGVVLADPNDKTKPAIDAIVLDRSVASSVNIPPKGEGQTNVPGADQPSVPVPLRALADDEELYFGFGRTILLRKKGQNLDVNTFTREDRELLQAIAAKLGIDF